jgi:hypothetical protein
MVMWSTFATEAPDLAARATERFEAFGMIMLGTVRASGGPRISPCEFVLHEGRFEMGMMWQSHKALDLLRDPRCVLHSCTTDKNGSEGDVKIYGRAVDEHDAARREAHGDAVFAKIGWRPEGEEWHLFVVDIDQVGYTKFGDGKQLVQTWRPGAPPTPLETRPAP